MRNPRRSPPDPEQEGVELGGFSLHAGEPGLPGSDGRLQPRPGDLRQGRDPGVFPHHVEQLV